MLLYVTVSLLRVCPETSHGVIRPRSGSESQSIVCGPLAGHVCFCVRACLYCMGVCICVCSQCMCSVWVMGLGHKAKHNSPHGHSGTAQAHQTLNTAQFTMYRLFYQCVYLNRGCQQAFSAVVSSVTNMFVVTQNILR